MLINLDKFRTDLAPYWDASTFCLLLWSAGTKSLHTNSTGTSTMEGDKDAQDSSFQGCGGLEFWFVLFSMLEIKWRAFFMLGKYSPPPQMSDTPSPL